MRTEEHRDYPKLETLERSLSLTVLKKDPITTTTPTATMNSVINCYKMLRVAFLPQKRWCFLAMHDSMESLMRRTYNYFELFLLVISVY